MPRVRIGVDIGGTFTDLVLVSDDGKSAFLKISSTPQRPEDAVVAGIQAVLGEACFDPADIVEILHGTTIGSNTLLQKIGARCGLITTKGFRDVLEIGRVRTPSMFDLSWRKPDPLVRRRWRVEVVERIAADGTVLTPLDPDEAVAAASFLVGEGIESIAICFLNSYGNPQHEIAAAAAVRSAFPTVSVSASVEILPSMGEYERCSTAVVNAYVVPVMRGYIDRLEIALKAMGITGPLLIGNSNGGLSIADSARTRPVFFITSGRSAGAVGAARLGERIGLRNLIAFDMGGTTASAILIANGEVGRTHEYEFRDGISTPSRFIKAGGYLMRVPTINVAEVGSGAGSIASLDDGGLLRVGPMSAGALPGPVCYGLGGDRATVTDANVALGLLPPRLGGSITLDLERAREAIGLQISAPLGISIDAAAQGVRDVANANMARAIRAVTVERGVDPRDFILLAFGGSGPVHACELAAILGIRRVLFPMAPGVFTAAGMLASQLEYQSIRPLNGHLQNLNLEELFKSQAQMAAQAQEAFSSGGHSEAALDHNFSLELRFEGQEAAISVPLPPGIHVAEIEKDFLARYAATYGYVSKDRIEAAALRLATYLHDSTQMDFAALNARDRRPDRTPSRRLAFFGTRHGRLETLVQSRDLLVERTLGPLILESHDSTIVIPPGIAVEPDDTGNLIATISPEALRDA